MTMTRRSRGGDSSASATDGVGDHRWLDPEGAEVEFALDDLRNRGVLGANNEDPKVALSGNGHGMPPAEDGATTGDDGLAIGCS
jgi:hypothetical protein